MSFTVCRRGGFLQHLKFGFLFASGVFLVVAAFIAADKLERWQPKE